MRDIREILGKKVLFLGSHLDDVEFGCGALLRKCSQVDGIEVRIETLSKHNENAKGEVQIYRDIDEAESAMRTLGYKRDNWIIDNIPGQRFDSYRQEIRELLLQIRRNFAPETVFFPAFNDIHQDHSTLADEAFRIFRDVNCMGYEVIRSTRRFEPNIFVEITEDELSSKLAAVLMYESQKEQSAAYYFDEKIVRSIAVFRGAQANIGMAEAYCVYCYRIKR